MLDEPLFEQLFKSHFKGLCQFAAGYIKDQETARSIVQDTFVSLWGQRERIDPGKSVKTYLSTSVRNKCLNHLRDHKKFSQELLEVENLPDSYTFEPSDPLEINELQIKIDSSVSELPEKCREIFLLHRDQNLKYTEIAGKLGISVKTVETQMSRALSALRSALREYLPILFLLFYFIFNLL
jgi:RNA polymerase sigma-70 factor (ECF subfamily)